jgi:hypothetical protein
VTASEQSRSRSRAPEGARALAQQLIDALVYLPAGAVLSALDDVPETVAKGRARVDQELRNAKLVGRFVVDLGRRQLKGQVQTGAAGGPSTTRRSPGRPGPLQGQAGPAQRREPRPRPSAADRDPEVDRAIPDYDILAASQVVRRLGGLGQDELRAVVRHERATRCRRTILQRAEQLLGGAPRDRAAGDRAGPEVPRDDRPH